MRSQLQRAIRSQIDRIAVIDSHEHIESLDLAHSCRNDVFRTFSRSFIEHDLSRTGVIDARWRAANLGEVDGWLALKRHLRLCRNTGYFRSFLIAVRDLLGLPIVELDDTNWEQVSHALAEANRREDWYRYVLKERCHIDAVLWDLPPQEPSWHSLDSSLFVPLGRFDDLANLHHPDFRRFVAQAYGIEPRSVADMLHVLDIAFQQAVEEGIAGVKIAAAYFRHIRFDERSAAEASAIFDKRTPDLTYPEIVAFQDFMFSQIIERCIAHNLPIQIHTGMQSRVGYLHNGYPLYLERTVRRYPEARFLLLHAGYPFTAQAAVLAAQCPNVLVDGSWLPILSPSAYRKTVSEWLDLLPVERIVAWGGDALRVEMAYGSLAIAKDAIADVLAEKVEKGCFSEGKAAHIASRILRDNLRELFRTDDVRDRRLKNLRATKVA